jgi:hypothetical protein
MNETKIDLEGLLMLNKLMGMRIDILSNRLDNAHAKIDALHEYIMLGIAKNSDDTGNTQKTD